MINSEKSSKSDSLLRTAVLCGLVGLLCVLLFLWRGFTAWSIGLGMFFGVPVLVVALILYIIAVVRDLRERGAL